MKPRTIITVVLLLFVAVSVTHLVINEIRGAGAPTKNETNPSETQSLSDTMTTASQTDTLNPSASGPESADETTAPTNVASGTPGRGISDRTQVTPSQSTGTNPAPTSPQATAMTDSEARKSATTDRVVAYYFHGTKRCPTCMKLEAFSKESLEQGFPAELKDGRLEWRVTNVDEPENAHFVNDYKLYTRSLVILKLRDGKQTEWKNLEKIWDLVGDRDSFLKYVQDEVRAYLRGEVEAAR